jgi:Glucose-regulated metallo-peptidase M90
LKKKLILLKNLDLWGQKYIASQDTDMFANLIALPFALSSLFFLYMAWMVDQAYSVYIIPFLLVSALIFVFQPQINWWWYSKRPPQLPAPFLQILERCSPFYQKLQPEQRKTFQDRVALFRMATDWSPQGFPEDELPPDIALALSAQAVTLSFGRSKYLIPKFEKVIIYPRPFPSPEHPFEHASELYVPDGCLLFSGEQVMRAFLQPQQWYNVGLHEYAKVFALENPTEPWPQLTDSAWEALERVSKMPRTHVESVIGLENVDALPVAIHHFFIFAEAFSREMPQEAHTFAEIFWKKK